MIPVVPQPEPSHFNQIVRIPGNAFLQINPHPKSEDYEPKYTFWREILNDLRKVYNNICAYSAHWLPPGITNVTVDHFQPKSKFPQLAYEWSNYRLACHPLNTNKGSQTDVLDPFTLAQDWFVIMFPDLLVKPNSSLNITDQTLVSKSIDRLKLNNEKLIELRQSCIDQYVFDNIPFNYLKKNAPFLAYELDRQGLRDGIKLMWTMA